MLVNVLVWGASLVIVKPALDFTTPFRFLLYRFVLACFLSLPFLYYYWPRVKKPWAAVKMITGLEILGTTTALYVIYAGLALTSAVEASLIATLMPLAVTAFGVWLLKEKEEPHEMVGLIIALAGTLGLVLLPVLNNGHVLSSGSTIGNLLVLSHVLLAGLYYVLAKKYYHRLPKLFVSTISFWVGLVSFFLLSLMEMSWSWTELVAAIRLDLMETSVWVASGYMAVFGSIIGLTAYIKGQDGIEASEATLFNYLQPLVYLPLAAVLLGEYLGPWQWVILGVIASGVFLAERRVAHKSWWRRLLGQ